MQRAWALTVVLSSAALAQAPLDGFPIRGTLGISAGAYGDDVLVAWNSVGPFPFSIYWTILQGDGGLSKAPDANALGEFSGSPVHVVAAPDAGMWMVFYPDKSGGGASGGARISARTGASLDSYGSYHSTQTFTRRLRGAWAQGRWWAIEENNARTLYTVTSTNVTTPPRPEPEVSPQYELTASGDRLFIGWVADGGGTIDMLIDGGRLARTTSSSVSQLNLAAAEGVVLIVSASPAGVTVQRFNESLQPLGLAVVVGAGPAFDPKISFDGADFVIVWESRRGVSELRMVRVRPDGFVGLTETLVTGPIRTPDVAGVRPGEVVVAWLAGDGGPDWFPYARRVTSSVIDAGIFDAGVFDAGVMLDAGTGSDAGLDDAGIEDAGAEDAGSDDAGIDAGSDDAGIDAGSSDAGVTPLEPGDFHIGCSCSSWPDPLWLAVLLFARRRR